MKKTTVLIGNGIGRSLDDNYFKISSGLNEARKLNENNIIVGEPTEEGELEEYHIISVSCDSLKKNMISKKFLTDQGINFPRYYSKFLFDVARYFFFSKHKLPEDFLKNIINFIKKSSPHIVTLNYDKLLYSPLCKEKVLHGYDGCLVDGFLDSGFSEDNLIRKHGNNFGWYLHLHGSPIFYSDIQNKIMKTKWNENNLELEMDENHNRIHFVLSHTKHKPSIITGSELLSSYWSYFKISLTESDTVLLFGYSGSDNHVNQEINNWIYNGGINGKKIIVVSHSNDSFKQWVEIFPVLKSEDVKLMDNILNFDFKILDR